MEKHTSYYNLLEQLDDPACPVCIQLEGSLKNFLDSYLYEGVTDRDNWAKLIASDGYCSRHCTMLEKFSDGLAVAIFYSVMLRDKLKKLGTKEKKSWFKKSEAPCPACEYEESIEADQCLLLAQALEEKEFQASFDKHPGLCLPHAQKVASHGGQAKIKTTARLEALCEELDEFIRKSDHRNDEKMGAEGDSWQRVLRQFHGIRFGRDWNQEKK